MEKFIEWLCEAGMVPLEVIERNWFAFGRSRRPRATVVFKCYFTVAATGACKMSPAEGGFVLIRAVRTAVCTP